MARTSKVSPSLCCCACCPPHGHRQHKVVELSETRQNLIYDMTDDMQAFRGPRLDAAERSCLWHALSSYGCCPRRKLARCSSFPGANIDPTQRRMMISDIEVIEYMRRPKLTRADGTPACLRDRLPPDRSYLQPLFVEFVKTRRPSVT